MDVYIARLTVAAASSNSAEFTGIAGAIRKIGILWPRNAGGFLFAKFKIGELEIPATVAGTEEYMTAENIFIQIDLDPPYTAAGNEIIKIEGYNTDATYEHSVYLWLFVE